MTNNPFDGLIGSQEACQLWGLNESTLRKAISYGKFEDGVDMKKFGKQWVFTVAALERVYGKVKAED